MIDVKDKKILEELMIDARVSITQLAKKTGISREVATYRLNRLQKNIVLGYYTLINYHALGFKQYVCFIQLKGISAQKELEFMEYLNKHEYITYFGPVIGKWNVVFDIIARDEQHVKEILLDVTAKINPYLDSYVVNSISFEGENYPMKILDSTKLIVQKKLTKKTYLIDELDKRILKLLSTNARIEYADISKKLKTSANTIKYRIKNLERCQIIEGYKISIDYTQLGIEVYTLQLKLTNTVNKQFIAYLKNHPKVWFYVKCFGQESWDIGVGVIVKNHNELRSIMIELKNNFGELLKIHDMYLITHIIKDNVAPDGVFK